MHIKKHYFIHFCCFFLKSLEALSVSLMTPLLRSLLISFLKYFFFDSEKTFFCLHKEISIKFISSMRAPDVQSRIHVSEVIFLQVPLQFATKLATLFWLLNLILEFFTWEVYCSVMVMSRAGFCFVEPCS